ncbi:NAD(P)/FAD-dependent oxidoreductase [Brevundimonas naejangsanensis]|uniref:NAD(P)/FAD-dependent oxidoreductase n=1 Tax=Brevundimonas naejangsanensis TaxID=588932 RepID=UPI0003F9DDE4|nr:FAD-dependent oxidoreductase [Brevundimonas naejangsanensis]
MERLDVVVIGGGLVGAATAFRLAQAGASVAVVEAGYPNIGASGANAGSLHFQLERRFLENGEALADQAAQVLSLNRLAIEEWRRLDAEMGPDLHIHMRGGLMVAETADQVRTLERKVAREVEGGLDTRLIDGAEARIIAPGLSEAVTAAAYLASEGHADPKALTPAFMTRAQTAGVQLLQGARLTAVGSDAQGYRLTVRRGEADIELATRKVLIAAGAWTGRIGELFNLHLPIYPVALLMNVTERAPPMLEQLIQHVGQRLSMKQAHAGNMLIGGGWPSRMRLDATGRFDLDRSAELLTPSLAGNLGVASRIFPPVAELNLIRSWTGITAITADQTPLVGEVPQAPGVYVAAGGSAFTLGPVFARLLARLILDEREDRLSIFSPARFGHLNSFMGGRLA